MTNNTQLTIDDVIATLEGRKAAISARDVPHFNYVLSWGNGLYVHVDPVTKRGSAAGFEHAAFFGDLRAAQAYRDRTNIRNGRNEHPHPVAAFNAQQGALIDLDKVIADITTAMEA
jgi:hypothetical protein